MNDTLKGIEDYMLKNGGSIMVLTIAGMFRSTYDNHHTRVYLCSQGITLEGSMQQILREMQQVKDDLQCLMS